MNQDNARYTSTGFNVAIRGHFVQPSAIIDTKTGKKGKNLHAQALNQVWFSRTPILYGCHYDEGGGFSSVLETGMIQEGKLEDWEKQNAEKLNKFVRVIEMIRDGVKKAPGGKCILIHSRNSDTLNVCSDTSGYICGLLVDILSKWNA